ncbi:MAG: flagellar type III secretion system protein FliR [Rhodospirillaceae bacterium]|jgi:flagellar biosynthesis protein FliR|nr:flagellar type III secretion system protein FliR [Rhodospirillaceae bacterium]MBT5245488.1 flagellar type III secretion system protein FliR [Rhodospirillaceae bacterium]MBT5560970.1 flagellar type III secretion system protein FliR [Rhodospirillaceae bacterium]MBT6240606.1 flagellar type III secretion system protein FliR [Rhodospirillaceae bacterium]MBT7137929.1 flagellar type III secretion system protein FliR [Rhodospirillaceae bacterium]
MLSDLIQINLFAFFLLFARIGTVFMLMPGIGTAYVPVKVRLTIALAICFIITPLLVGGLPVAPGSQIDMMLLLLSEVTVGLFIGLVARITVGALQTTGTLIALFSSLANALIRDPIAEQQSSLIATFLSMLGMVLIIVTDLHHLMIRGVIESYSLFVPGQSLSFGDFSEMLARRFADSFKLGVQLSSPFLLTALVYYVGLGILGRLMPALPVFIVVMPLQIAGQLSFLMVSLSAMMMYFLSQFEDAIIVFLEP